MWDEEEEDWVGETNQITVMVDHGDNIVDYLRCDGDKADLLATVLQCLRHWADAQGITYAGGEAESFRRYMRDLAEDSDNDGLAHSARYTGWDRCHDDNKAEGRPIGNQWADSNVEYRNGIKVHVS